MQSLLLETSNIEWLVAWQPRETGSLNENVAPSHPAGRLRLATPTSRSYLSRLAKTGRAVRMAAGIYVVDGALPPEALARHHAVAIAVAGWPFAVLCHRSGF